MKKVAECLYRNESSGTYFALVKRSGKQIRRSLKTQDRKLAERRLSEFRREVGNLSTKPEDRGLSFNTLCKRWLAVTNSTLKQATAKRNEEIAAGFKALFSGAKVSDINRQQCEDWLVKRSKKVSARTSNYDLQILKRILDYAVETGIILSNPAAALRPRKERKAPILVPTRGQFESLIETLADMTRADSRVQEALRLVKLLAYSGMRLGEATRIFWREIDFENSRFTVSGGDIGTKNGEARIVPLFPKLDLFLKDLVGDFESVDGDSRIIVIKSAKKALHSASRIAELPYFSHHCLRHYFVSNAVENGVDFKTIAGWVGHKDGGLLVAKTYGHLRDVHSFEMAKLMV